MRRRRQSLLSRAPSHIFNHISSFIVSSTIVSMNRAECGENTSNECTSKRMENGGKNIRVWSIFHYCSVHCFDSKTKFYSTCRYSSRVTCTHTPLSFVSTLNLSVWIYIETKWNDIFVVIQWIFIFTHANLSSLRNSTQPSATTDSWLHDRNKITVVQQTHEHTHKSTNTNGAKIEHLLASKEISNDYVRFSSMGLWEKRGPMRKLLFLFFDKLLSTLFSSIFFCYPLLSFSLSFSLFVGISPATIHMSPYSIRSESRNYSLLINLHWPKRPETQWYQRHHYDHVQSISIFNEPKHCENKRIELLVRACASRTFHILFWILWFCIQKWNDVILSESIASWARARARAEDVVDDANDKDVNPKWKWLKIDNIFRSAFIFRWFWVRVCVCVCLGQSHPSHFALRLTCWLCALSCFRLVVPKSANWLYFVVPRVKCIYARCSCLPDIHHLLL